MFIRREQKSLRDSCKFPMTKSSILKCAIIKNREIEKYPLYMNDIFSKVKSLRNIKKYKINNINNFSFLNSLFIF